VHNCERSDSTPVCRVVVSCHIIVLIVILGASEGPARRDPPTSAPYITCRVGLVVFR